MGAEKTVLVSGAGVEGAAPSQTHLPGDPAPWGPGSVGTEGSSHVNIGKLSLVPCWLSASPLLSSL